MLLFNLNQTSIDEVAQHIANVQERALVGIRLGMRDGVRGLAQAEAEAVSGHNKTGHLQEVLSRAGRVIETDDSVEAVYQPRSGGKQEHYWLEYGAAIPEVENVLMRMNLSGEEFFRFGHKAFHLPAHPFFFSTAEAYVERWMELLFGRVEEALTA